MAKLKPNGLGQKGLSINAAAKRMGLHPDTVKRYCRLGKILHAEKHPLTKKWWIYPPFKVFL